MKPLLGDHRRAALAQTSQATPDLLATASDNDPTNVGTATVVGAHTGYQLAWLALLIAPLLAVVQLIALQVAVVAHSDLQSLTSRQYGKRAASILLISVVVVNIVTIAADLQAGASGLSLIVHVDARWLVLPLALALVSLLLIGRYDQVVAVLRYLLVGFLAFGAAAIMARPQWKDPPGDRAGKGLVYSRFGAIAGAIFTAGTFWCMLTASAATLGRHHHSVATTQDAAQAIRPLAGPLADDVFAAALVVSALVALPVLMATTAYAVGAHFDWRRGLSEPLATAPAFYAVLVGSILLAVAGASRLTVVRLASLTATDPMGAGLARRLRSFG